MVVGDRHCGIVKVVPWKICGLVEQSGHVGDLGRGTVDDDLVVGDDYRVGRCQLIVEA